MAIIRTYTAADKEGCLDAFKSNMPTFFTSAELADYEKWLDDQFIPGNTLPDESAEEYFVAEIGRQIVGCGGYYIHLKKKQATLTWGLVNHQFQKQGIGKELFLHRMEAIQSISPESNILLDTTQHSYPFFHKFGFVITKIQKDFYAKGIDRYDMELKK